MWTTCAWIRLNFASEDKLHRSGTELQGQPVLRITINAITSYLRVVFQALQVALFETWDQYSITTREPLIPALLFFQMQIRKTSVSSIRRTLPLKASPDRNEIDLIWKDRRPHYEYSRTISFVQRSAHAASMMVVLPIPTTEKQDYYYCSSQTFFSLHG